MRAGTVYGRLGIARQLASGARAFHWPLEFPDIMNAGGFDSVLGNPPWEVMQLNEEEYFMQRSPEVAELAGAKRKAAISKLESEKPDLYKTYLADLRMFDAMNEFARSSDRFPLSARGKLNTYPLFAELFTNLLKGSGRAGVIVPTGIATDSGTSTFLAAQVDSGRLASLFDFENQELLFPFIDSRMKFSLLTLAAQAELATFAFFLTNSGQLSEKERLFTLSPAEIAVINPNT